MTLDVERRVALAGRWNSTEPALRHLYVSHGHNFFGHHGQPAGTNRMMEVPSIECVAAHGIRGDRFFSYKENYKGQITFFALEVYESLCHQLQVFELPPAVFRRNVITQGIDLNSFIGEEFVIQGVRFHGTEECRPCHWMDLAFAPGAEAALRGRGGLRAMVLTSGNLNQTAPVKIALQR